MKVGAFTSVGAKLFYYMSGLVLLTVIGSSIQFRKSFMESQTKQIQDSVQGQAERTSAQIESSIESWRSQIAVALPTLRGDGTKSAAEVTQRFIDSSPDYISLQLLSSPSKSSSKFVIFGEAFTTNTSDARFEEKSAEKVKATVLPGAISWLQKKASSTTKANFFLENSSKVGGLPIAWIATRFDVAGDQTVVWAILGVWQSNLVKALAKSRFIESMVIDREGRIFSAPRISDVVGKKNLSANFLTQEALKATSPSGFVPEFKDANSKRRIGAFSRLPRYGLTILVDQDVEFAYQTLNKNLLNTGLWAALFVLVSMMFAFVGATGITRGLRVVAEATSRISSGDFTSQINLKSRDEVGLLGHAVNNMSRKILDLMNSQVEKARFEKELETAKMVQSTFFPKTDRSNDILSISGFYQPASECGGDLWGHFTLEEGLEFVFVADAMGHGAPAAMVTAMAYSATMTIADIIKENPSLRDSPAKILTRLNSIIWEAVRGSISITFFASVIDLRKGTITYANAGHNFPIILPQKSDDSRTQALKPVVKNSPLIPISLKLMGTPLGMDLMSSYKDQTIEICPGDKIFYFTDGLIECESPEGLALGRKWLLENICTLADANAHGMKNEILGRAFDFFGPNPIKDDITVVVIEVSKEWSPEVSNTFSVEMETHQVPPAPFYQSRQEGPEMPILIEAASVAPDNQVLNSTSLMAGASEATQTLHERSKINSTIMPKIRLKSPFSA